MEATVVLVVATVFLMFTYLYAKRQADVEQQQWEEGQRKQRLQREEEEREEERLHQKRLAEEREREKLRQQEAERQRNLREAQASEERAKRQREAKLQQEREEQERQAEILQQQKLERRRKAAERKQQTSQELAKKPAARAKPAEKPKISPLKQPETIVQPDFCETGTTYWSEINGLFRNDPKGFRFETIRSLSTNHGVIDQLERGVKQLETYQQLSQYVFTYGLMHQAKLQQAYDAVFSNNHLPLTGQSIEIIDYGCGQGIGTICLIDYIKAKTNCNCTIERVRLIEPSALALKRAFLNVRHSLKSLGQSENVVAVNKEIDNLTSKDIETQHLTTKIHVFSNIIDVEDFELSDLYRNIEITQSGTNIFVCVSPNIMQSRNQRLDRFQGYFVNQKDFTIISGRESDIPNPRNPDKPYRRYERIFKVEQHVNTLNSAAIRVELSEARAKAIERFKNIF